MCLQFTCGPMSRWRLMSSPSRSRLLPFPMYVQHVPSGHCVACQLSENQTKRQSLEPGYLFGGGAHNTEAYWCVSCYFTTKGKNRCTPNIPALNAQGALNSFAGMCTEKKWISSIVYFESIVASLGLFLIAHRTLYPACRATFTLTFSLHSPAFQGRVKVALQAGYEPCSCSFLGAKN